MSLLFDKEQFKVLMNDFYIITNIKIVFYDNNLAPIISVPDNDCDFCTTLKKNKESLAKCELCIEKEVEKCKELNKINIYKCHSGLTEAVAPIKIDDIIIGYIMIGQIIDKEDKQGKKSDILNYVSQYCKDDMNEKFDEITCKSIIQIQSVAKLMETCISYLIMHHLIKSEHTGLIFRIANFINSNLTEDLSVNRLCNTFSISRNALYKIFNDYYGISVSKCIRKKRIETAIKLIESGISITDASSMVGYYDYNYFSKVFKSETGILPSKFRRKIEKAKGFNLLK